MKVEIDRDTGTVDILGYWLVDDCGTRLNPVTVEGQTMGGIAQGVGAALLEEYVYDEAGVLQNAGFLDYRMPVALDMPMIDTAIAQCRAMATAVYRCGDALMVYSSCRNSPVNSTVTSSPIFGI